MRVTKASLEAAVATYAEMKKLPGETMPQALDRLAKNRDPLLIALYDEAQSAPSAQDSMSGEHSVGASRNALEDRVEKQARTHIARGMTPEQAVAKVLAEDPSLYDRWLDLN